MNSWESWKNAILPYYRKQLDHSLTEEDKRLLVEGCEENIKRIIENDYLKYESDNMNFIASLYNLASFYEEEGYERLANKYFALYRKVEEMN